MSPGFYNKSHDSKNICTRPTPYTKPFTTSALGYISHSKVFARSMYM